ncbi:methyltransferase [Hoeflea poritis]|uniref:Methyltransferase n=1 Tax=Hoeflea poritis TaxID=2993659 RepID=A0ABT4VKJ8_9HYPH|nr:methyltransferase [Hoeflea poritis]MDA4845252.1 methyltransferase [Hoeflea poritis]
MSKSEFDIAKDSLDAGNFSLFIQEQERRIDSSTIGLITEPEIFEFISSGLGEGHPNNWITRESTWNSGLYGPDHEMSVSEHFLHAVWQVFSLRVARKLEIIQSKVRISDKGAIICFPGGFDLSVLVSYEGAGTPGSVFIRPIAAIQNPTGMLDLEGFLENSTPREKNAIKSAVTSVDKLVYHRGTIVHVDRQRENVFGPTVDTVVLSELLNIELRKRKKKSTSILEVGPGSGLITVSAALNPATSRIVSVEINEDAASCTLKNLQINGRRPTSSMVSVSVRAEKFKPQTLGEKFDIIVCNPPYVPEEDDGLEKLGATGYGKAISGLELYDDVINNLDHLLQSGGRALLMMSSVSFDYAINRIQEGFEFEFPLGRTGYKVPFDLDMLWDRPSWKDQLLSNKSIEQDGAGTIYHRIVPIWIHRNGQ